MFVDYNFWWKQLRYHPVQNALWNYTGRFAAVVAGRRSGKTDICRKKLVLEAGLAKPWPNPIYFYLLPTYNQAKKVAWYPFCNLVPEAWIKKKSETELSFTLVNGAKLYIAGADKPKRIEGVPSDFIMVDESSDQQPGLYERTILPMLTERQGKCYRLGVPKRDGVGKIDFRKFYEKGLRGEDGIASFTWPSEDILDPEEVALVKSQLTERDFNEQFRAKWQDIGSSVYYNFTTENIRDDFDYDPAYEICVGCDFNVDPMCWTLGQYIDGKLFIFDEIFLKNTNTPATLDFLSNRFAGHSAGWRFFGDATSKARKTSAVRSDYILIKSDARFGQKRVLFPERNPALRDRFASVNAAFKNANKEIRVHIHVRCKRLIDDLTLVSYIEGTSEVQDYSGTEFGHMSDAFGYSVHSLMPVRNFLSEVPTVLSA